MKRIESVFETVKSLCDQQYNKDGQISGVTTDNVAAVLGIQRPNASGDLNALVKDKRLEKTEGKPVLYKVTAHQRNNDTIALERSALDEIIGADQSLKTAVQQAKAAVIYPPLGLHTLLLGETGVGKSMFAEAIFSYAQDIGRLRVNAPFILFNCADYAHNPQLLLGQLFGVKKGSYTGAERDKAGLVEKANGGILFLDEIHRLPPEGQEMLFYLIDKGLFRSMGEADAYRKVDILIICATTENADSSLLSTFTRRIPMIIKLPVIRERTMTERWELIKSFFTREVQLLNVPITVSPNALKAFMLYDCPNNIGQLKSDIKLSCARAFLDYVGNHGNALMVNSEDLPEYILQGFVKYKQHRTALDKIGLTEAITFQVSHLPGIPVQCSATTSIYEILEQKIKNLRTKGMNDEDIHLIMGLDIDTYLKQYMNKFQKDNLEELYKIVDRKVVDVTQQFLSYVSNQIGKQFNDKILFGMSIHISSTLERIREGKKISNPHLTEVQKSYESDFLAASHLVSLLKEHFGVQIPLDEIGFITMFIVFDEYICKESPGRVGVVVAMHGTSTATSMAEVANRLLGEKHAIGYDMPLDKKTETALVEITKLVEEQHEGQGVIMLVDMGSLVMFGDMIYEQTSIPIKTIEMTSTPMVLEAVRKALMRVSLEDIYHAVTNLSPYIGRMYGNQPEFANQLKANVIVTACITGKGTAIKLKSMIEKSLVAQKQEIDIIPIEINNMKDYNQKLLKIQSEKNLIAVVSSINPLDISVPYISTKELLEGKLDILLSGTTPDSTALSPFKKLNFMEEIINENLNIDGKVFMDAFQLFYMELLKNDIIISEDICIGLTLHIACLAEKLLANEQLVTNNYDTIDMDTYGESYAIVKAALRPLEDSLHIQLPDSKYCNIVKLIHSL